MLLAVAKFCVTNPFSTIKIENRTCALLLFPALLTQPPTMTDLFFSLSLSAFYRMSYEWLVTGESKSPVACGSEVLAISSEMGFLIFAWEDGRWIEILLAWSYIFRVSKSPAP